jgi:ribonuclease P protein component
LARRRGPAEVKTLGRTQLDGAAADERPRLGIVAGKGVGTAVDRNRAKRLLREAVRRCTVALGPGWDLVLIARKPLAAAKQPQAELAVRELLRRAGALDGRNP